MYKFERVTVRAMLLGKDAAEMTESIAAQTGAKAHPNKHVSPTRDLVAVSGQRLMVGEAPRTTFLRNKDFEHLVDAVTDALNTKAELQALLIACAEQGQGFVKQGIEQGPQPAARAPAARFTLKFRAPLGRAEVWEIGAKGLPAKTRQFDVSYVFFVLEYNTLRSDLWIINTCFPVEADGIPGNSQKLLTVG